MLWMGLLISCESWAVRRPVAARRSLLRRSSCVWESLWSASSSWRLRSEKISVRGVQLVDLLLQGNPHPVESACEKHQLVTRFRLRTIERDSLIQLPPPDALGGSVERSYRCGDESSEHEGSHPSYQALRIP